MALSWRKIHITDPERGNRTLCGIFTYGQKKDGQLDTLNTVQGNHPLVNRACRRGISNTTEWTWMCAKCIKAIKGS